MQNVLKCVTRLNKMDGLGFIFHTNKHGMILHAESYGTNGLQFMPCPRIQCLGKSITDLYEKETAIQMQNAIELALNYGPAASAFAFSYTHKRSSFDYPNAMHGRTTYLRDGVVLIVVEVGPLSLV